MTNAQPPKRSKKLLVVTALAALIVLALLYLQCGKGFGTGGEGKGPAPGSSELRPVLAPVDAGVRRCSVRVAASGITVDGQPATREEAVTRCAATSGADVVVTGDARQGDWDDLRAALDAVGVAVFTKQP